MRCNAIGVPRTQRILLLGIILFTGLAISLSAQNQNVTLKAYDVPINQIFKSIQQQTNLSVIYNIDDINPSQRVSVDLNNRPVGEVLNTLLSNAGEELTYVISDNYIVVTRRDAAQAQATAQQQRKIVSGFVVDENNEPLIGVNVIVENTGTGTATDSEGHFSLPVPGESRLTFSYIGYTPQLVSTAGITRLRIVMSEDGELLDEVVVTALGIRRSEKALTYNVQQLGGDEVNRISDVNFVNNLSGKIAGVTINSSSAGVGGSSRVVMRGVKSISGNNNALYVIDGIPMPDLMKEQPQGIFEGAGQTGDGVSNINPEDIESITVLSGPSAAALYGSSASNGVIMITTKRGVKERLTINVTNSTQFSDPLILPTFQNSYGPTERGSYYSWGEKLETPSDYSPRDIFQTGMNISNSVSLSTGSENNQTYVSFGTVTAQGVIHNNNYDRYNFSVRNTSLFFDQKMTMDLGFMTSNVKELNMVAQGQYFNPLVAAYLFPPGDDFSKVQIYERYNISRNFKTQFWPYGDQGLSMQNPYWITERNKFLNNKERYMTNATLRYNFADWINLSGRVKIDKSSEKFEKKYNASTNTLFASENGYYALNTIKTGQVYGEALLNINKYFAGPEIHLTANIGSSIEDIVYDQHMYGGKLHGVANLFTFGNVNTSTSESSQTGYHKQKQSLFASTQMGYKSMVYLDLTARNDWASTLAESDNKSFFYPSIGLSGIITDIFHAGSDLMPYMKLRVSYSEVGNEPGLFLTIPTYSLTGGYPQTQTRMPNTDLKPERTKSWEAGANFYFFNNKLKLDATLYRSSTFNQFFEPTLSSTSGYTSVIVNAGQIDNKGVEITASFNEELGKLNWTSYLTYSLNRNSIVELLPEWENPVTGEIISLSELDMGGTGSYKMILKEGGSMGDIYVNTLRTDEHGAIYVHPTDQVVVGETNNYVYAGNSNPRYNLGWGNNFSWNGISMRFLLSARVGGVVVSNTQAILDAFGVSQASADARDNGGAIVNGRPIPAREYYQTVGGGPTGGIGSMYTYSATNVRLSELTLGYDIPIGRMNNWIKGVNLSFIGRNLFFIHNKAPYDPEITANTGTYYQGVDYFMLPSLRNLGFSVKVQF